MGERGVGGGGMLHLVAQRGGVVSGLKPENRNQAAGARSRVHCWEWLWGVMRGVGWVVGAR